MSVIIDFLRTYWREVLEVACLVATLILWIVKKKSITLSDTLEASISKFLPLCILTAEGQKDIKGKDKLDFAIEVLKDLLNRYCSASLDVLHEESARKQIELILSTPQKKER